MEKRFILLPFCLRINYYSLFISGSNVMLKNIRPRNECPPSSCCYSNNCCYCLGRRVWKGCRVRRDKNYFCKPARSRRLASSLGLASLSIWERRGRKTRRVAGVLLLGYLSFRNYYSLFFLFVTAVCGGLISRSRWECAHFPHRKWFRRIGGGLEY